MRWAAALVAAVLFAACGSAAALPSQPPTFITPTPAPTGTVEIPPVTLSEPIPEATPSETPVPTPEGVSAQSVASVQPLSSDFLAAVYQQADVPPEWRSDLAIIAECESQLDPTKVGDGGQSLGLHQLWRGWFRADEDPFDPVTNSRVAVRVRAVRGRYGGAGGWTCADTHGIP